MVDKTPILNGLSIKQRAKKLESKSPTNLVLDSMSKRGASYTGKKLAEQQENQKGPTMNKRGASYTGKKLAEQQDSQKGAALTKRAAKYTATPKEEDFVYVPNTQFVLRLDQYVISCVRVSNLTMAQDIEEIREGGNNDAPMIFSAPAKKSDVLSVERAMVNDEIAKKLKVGVRVKEGEVVIAYGNKEYRNLFFTDGVVTKCEYSNLDALGHEIILEKLEISHSGLTTEG